jgi:hypothetical protein
MGSATTPATFDPKPRQLGTVMDMIATTSVLAGQVVAFHGTGVAWACDPSDGVTTAHPIGVALHDAGAGAHVAVAGPGSVLKVCEGIGTAIDAGDMVKTSVTAGLGCVTTCAQVDEYQVGVAMEDITANLTGYVLLTCPIWVAKGA